MHTKLAHAHYLGVVESKQFRTSPNIAVALALKIRPHVFIRIPSVKVFNFWHAPLTNPPILEKKTLKFLYSNE